MKVRPTHLTMALLGAVGFLSLCSCQVMHGPDAGCGEDNCPVRAKVCVVPTMHALACDLDCLEAHIDKYGSVVAKQPDVWGEARLTKYREEFEEQMFRELTLFKDTLQGSISRSDQAYFANAFALSAAISGQQAGATPPRSRVVVQNNTAQGTTVTPTKLDVPPATPDTAVFAGFEHIQRTPLQGPLKLGFTEIAKGGIALEPTIHLDQKARYLDHLNQLRRNNEGDDTSDSPGYSLNLVRIPVSVLPGKHTKKGCGAEITFTLTPHVSDELLPTTFRQLAMNDVVDLLALPAVQVMDRLDAEKLPQAVRERLALSARIEQLLAKLKEEKSDAVTKTLIARDTAAPFLKGEGSVTRETNFESTAVREKVLRSVTNRLPTASATTKLTPEARKQVEAAELALRNARDAEATVARTEKETSEAEQELRQAESRLAEINKVLAGPKGSPRQRVALLALPPSQLVSVLGLYELAIVFKQVATLLKDHHTSQGQSYLLDARSLLREELAAAYSLLAQPNHAHLWQHCTPALVDAIRLRNDEQVRAMRTNFITAACPPGTEQTITSSLAWAIVVESALLNDRLVQDIKEAAAAKGCACQTNGPLPYFLPDPPAEARKTFNEYVRCRWPIHVFALDPATQDQNLADAYSRRQEMQLAISLAFVSGNMSARNMTRYARRLEQDMETVQIRRTHVGFSHGEDVFGWRFYPRFQTPPFESNAVSLFRDQLIGGPSKGAELAQERLEPGIRECVAIVLMPSFVPYLTCESSSNWFRLNAPKCKEFTTTDAVRLGRVVKSVQNCQDKITNADCYRDGDLGRLLAKAKQLEARLPLQNTMVQVPYENTLGGFEMFNTGITDLAPQLRGWYGGPGIQSKASTVLFLVGDHFSVHDTKVIAGGKHVEHTLLSRQIMRVVIPPDTATNRREYTPVDLSATGSSATATASGSAAPPAKKTFTYVDVHVATAYGVTSHLEIPLVDGGTPAAVTTGLAWDPESVELVFQCFGGGIAGVSPAQVRPPAKISWDVKKLGPPSPLAVSYDLQLTFANPYGTLSIPYPKTFDPSPVTVSFPATAFDKQKGALLVPADTMVAGAMAKFGNLFGPKNINPPIPVQVTKAVLTTKNKENGVIGKTELSNRLTITWLEAHVACATPAAACCPAPAPPPSVEGHPLPPIGATPYPPVVVPHGPHLPAPTPAEPAKKLEATPGKDIEK